MSSETDQPRQRTVAELLAEHGDSAATGRRRRRREADASGEVGAAADPAPGTATATATDAAPPPTPPRRTALDEPVPDVGLEDETEAALPPVAAPVPRVDPDSALTPWAADEAFTPPEQRRPPDPVRDRATDRMSRIRDIRPGALDPSLTGPIELPGSADGPSTEAVAVPDVPTDGPPVAGEEPPVPVTVWQRLRESRRSAASDDAGPPTQAGAAPDLDDPPAVLGADADDLLGGHDGPDDQDKRGAPGRDGLEGPPEPGRRLGRSAVATSPGQAWMAVVAQWIVGAVGGAALWVGFRFLWRELPVVALAAAVLVTVGLVLVVRALLRNDDLRTTVFAVLVGLLLTVSPALLVLLGR